MKWACKCRRCCHYAAKLHYLTYMCLNVCAIDMVHNCYRSTAIIVPLGLITWWKAVAPWISNLDPKWTELVRHLPLVSIEWRSNCHGNTASLVHFTRMRVCTLGWNLWQGPKGYKSWSSPSSLDHMNGLLCWAAISPDTFNQYPSGPYLPAWCIAIEVWFSSIILCAFAPLPCTCWLAQS